MKKNKLFLLVVAVTTLVLTSFFGQKFFNIHQGELSAVSASTAVNTSFVVSHGSSGVSYGYRTGTEGLSVEGRPYDLWTRFYGAPYAMTYGDINGDNTKNYIGSYHDSGLWYYDEKKDEGRNILPSSMARVNALTFGNITGNKETLIISSVGPNRGIWYLTDFSKIDSLDGWERIHTGSAKALTFDDHGNNLIGSNSDGIFYYNYSNKSWEAITTKYSADFLLYSRFNDGSEGGLFASYKGSNGVWYYDRDLREVGKIAGAEPTAMTYLEERGGKKVGIIGASSGGGIWYCNKCNFTEGDQSYNWKRLPDHPHGGTSGINAMTFADINITNSVSFKERSEIDISAEDVTVEALEEVSISPRVVSADGVSFRVLDLVAGVNYNVSIQVEGFEEYEKEIIVTNKGTDNLNQKRHNFDLGVDYEGFTCGETFTYRGQDYGTAQFGSQCWMTENLNYKSGESGCLGEDKAGPETQKEENCERYGRLYNWETSMQVCPEPMRLPSDEDWAELEIYFGMDEDDAKKEASYRGDKSVTDRFRNEFSVRYGGYYNTEQGRFRINYKGGTIARWATSSTSPADSNKLIWRGVNSNPDVVGIVRNDHRKDSYGSVRCVVDVDDLIDSPIDCDNLIDGGWSSVHPATPCSASEHEEYNFCQQLLDNDGNPTFCCCTEDDPCLSFIGIPDGYECDCVCDCGDDDGYVIDEDDRSNDVFDCSCACDCSY